MDACKLRGVFFLLLISISCQTFAQEEHLRKEIYLRTGKFNLDSLLHKITQQTGVVFSYNAKKFDARQRININAAVRNVKSFLEVLKKEKGFAIKVIENYVVITPAPKESLPKNNIQLALSATRKPGELKKTKIPEQNKLIQTKKDSVRALAHDSISKTKAQPKADSIREKKNAPTDSLVTLSKPIEEKSRKDSTGYTPPLVSSKNEPTRSADSVRVKNRANPARQPKSKTPITKNLFLKSGATVDESSFMGVTIQAGLPIVYATVSANSNLLASHVRYGIGSSIKVNPWLRLHVVANDGAVARSGFFTDSLGSRFPIAVKSNFLRIGLGMEFRLKGKLTLQLIPNFNQLTTSYFINDIPSSLSLFKNAGDGLFHTITPPYLISNTFSPNSDSNVKTWVGVQLNFLYRINFY